MYTELLASSYYACSNTSKAYSGIVTIYPQFLLSTIELEIIVISMPNTEAKSNVLTDLLLQDNFVFDTEEK